MNYNKILDLDLDASSIIEKYSKLSKQLSSSRHVIFMALQRLSFSLTRLTPKIRKKKRIILASIKFAWLCLAYKVIYIFGMELCSVISAITVCNIDGIDFDCKFGLKICHFATRGKKSKLSLYSVTF